MPHTTIINAARMKAHEVPTICDVFCANLRNNSFIGFGVAFFLSSVALREHYAIRSGVKFRQQFLNQTRLYPARLFRWHKIPDNCVQPGVRVHAKQHRWIFAHFELIHRRLGQDFTEDPSLCHHSLANFFGGDPLHRFRNEFEVAFISHTEFDFVPHIREDGPAVVVNGRTQYFGVRKLDDSSGRMIGRKQVTAAEFPQSRVEITDIDHVPGGVANLHAIADAIRRAHQDVNPAKKTGHRCLHREAKDQREQSDRNQRRIPVLKNNRDDREQQQESQEQLGDAPQVVSRNGAADASDQIDIHDLCSREQEHDHGGRLINFLNVWNISRGKAEYVKLQQVIKNTQRDQHEAMCSEPNLILGPGLGLILRRRGSRLLERLLHVFPFFYLFDFGAHFVRHSYRILARVWICCRESEANPCVWI